ncbi:YciI family protein [Micromonospora sp. BQ11]|uniref:YciI family protein n=1 Tax=Micromonospora sp. BQ11 TaxID=3452212 RepID=UPI003F8AC224
MKYMIMLYGSQRDYDAMAGRPTDGPAMTPEQVATMHEHMAAFHQKLVESGELVDAQGLTAPVHARRIQLSGGVPVVTDGPYPETQEVLAGYTVVDVASVDRAVEIAAGLVNPDAPGEYVDVRPIAEGIDDLDG